MELGPERIRTTLKIARAVFVVVLAGRFSGAGVCGQEPEVLALASEPHHRLALHNAYVNVYEVEVAPGDSVRLHRHDTDAISLSLSESTVTVHSPGKADVRQKLAFGQIRLQPLGYVHSTSVEGETRFRNVTVELLQPQTGKQNRCAQVMAAQALNCVGGQIGGSPLGQPQFETDQTLVGLVQLAPRKTMVIVEPERATLIVALDGGATDLRENERGSLLLAGGFVWLDKGKAGVKVRNDSAREVRLIYFGLAGADGATMSAR